MTLKGLQAKRDLLQNTASQKPHLERDLAEVERRIAEHAAATEMLTAERDALTEKLTAADAARAELPQLKRDLAAALAEDEQRKAGAAATGKRATASV